MATQKLVVDLTDNDELRGYLTAKGPGDTCEFEVVASLDDSTAEKAVFSVKEITAIRHEEPSAPLDEGNDGAAVLEAMNPGRTGGRGGERY